MPFRHQRVKPARRSHEGQALICPGQKLLNCWPGVKRGKFEVRFAKIARNYAHGWRKGGREFKGGTCAKTGIFTRVSEISDLQNAKSIQRIKAFKL